MGGNRGDCMAYLTSQIATRDRTDIAGCHDGIRGDIFAACEAHAADMAAAHFD